MRHINPFKVKFSVNFDEKFKKEMNQLQVSLLFWPPKGAVENVGSMVTHFMQKCRVYWAIKVKISMLAKIP